MEFVLECRKSSVLTMGPLKDAKDCEDDDEWESEIIPVIPPVTSHVHLSDNDDDDWDAPGKGSTNQDSDAKWWSDDDGANGGSDYWSNWKTSSSQPSSLGRTFAHAKKRIIRKVKKQAFSGLGKNKNSTETVNLDDSGVEMMDAVLCDQFSRVSLQPQTNVTGMKHSENVVFQFGGGAASGPSNRGVKRNSDRHCTVKGSRWDFFEGDDMDYCDGIPYEKYRFVLD